MWFLNIDVFLKISWCANSFDTKEHEGWNWLVFSLDLLNYLANFFLADSFLEMVEMSFISILQSSWVNVFCCFCLISKSHYKALVCKEAIIENY